MEASLTAAIFAYGGDALPVIECVRHLTQLGVRVWVFDDSKHRLPGWVQGQLWRMGAAYDVTKFPRRGNLNGTECCIGILEAMLSEERRDRQAKIVQRREARRGQLHKIGKKDKAGGTARKVKVRVGKRAR